MGCLDLVFSITHHSKSIGPIHATLVWMSFHFLFLSLKSHEFELWVSENLKKKKWFFWVIETELWWQIGGLTVRALSHHTLDFTPPPTALIYFQTNPISPIHHTSLSFSLAPKHQLFIPYPPICSLLFQSKTSIVK